MISFLKILLLGFILSIRLAPACFCSDAQSFAYKITNTYPHDSSHFTQGLVFENGFLYEGTGIKGESALYKKNLKTGQYLQVRRLAPELFGEGITIYKDKIIQITWKSHNGLVYDKESFKLLGNFSYPTEGWGITSNAKQLIMSDGSSTLYFLNPETFKEVKRMKVYGDNGPITGLNELEYIKGKIFANILGQPRIVIISLQTGQVTGWIDLKNLIDSYGLNNCGVLNGIAYDKDTGRLFITGKFWPKIFEIKLLP